MGIVGFEIDLVSDSRADRLVAGVAFQSAAQSEAII